MPIVHSWNDDGSKLFVGGIGGNTHGSDHDDEILEYGCTTDYDVSTCSFTRRMIINDDHPSGTDPSSYGVNIDMRRVFGMTFNNDGTKMYLNSGAQAPHDCQAGNGPNCRIYEITLDAAFDISSGTRTNTKSLIISSNNNQDGIPTGITFNNDGSKLFVAGFDDDDIIVYPLSTAYSLASSSVGTPTEFDVSSQSTNPRDIDFNNDGTKMYITVPAASADYISVYSLPTAFDLSGGYTHLGNYSVTSQDNQPWSVEFNDDGTKMFMIGYQNDYVHEYSLSTAFDLGFTDPTLTSSVPADNATGVALDANIVLNFSENVDRESGNLTIKKTSDDSTVQGIDIAGITTTGSGSSQITVNPDVTLEENTEYYVARVDDDQFKLYTDSKLTNVVSLTSAHTSEQTDNILQDTKVESVATISGDLNEDELWVISQRWVNGSVRRYVECFSDFDFDETAPEDFKFLDSHLSYSGSSTTTLSGLGHLEGQSVSILADGSVHANKTVSSGAITLDRAVTKACVGLSYDSVLQTMRIEGGAAEGTSQGKTKRISKVVLRLFETVGAKVGPSLDNLETVPFRTTSGAMDLPVSTFIAGDKEVEFSDDYNTDGFIFVKQDQALPLTVLALYPTIVTNDG